MIRRLKTGPKSFANCEALAMVCLLRVKRHWGLGGYYGCMENVRHRCLSLNSWFPAGGPIFWGFGIFRGWDLDEGSEYVSWSIEVYRIHFAMLFILQQTVLCFCQVFAHSDKKKTLVHHDRTLVLKVETKPLLSELNIRSYIFFKVCCSCRPETFYNLRGRFKYIHQGFKNT